MVFCSCEGNTQVDCEQEGGTSHNSREPLPESAADLTSRSEALQKPFLNDVVVEARDCFEKMYSARPSAQETERVVVWPIGRVKFGAGKARSQLESDRSTWQYCRTLCACFESVWRLRQRRSRVFSAR